MYSCACGPKGLIDDFKTIQLFRFSVRGFSPKRMAYILTGINTLLLPFEFGIDYRLQGPLFTVAVGCVLGTLILAFCMPRTEKNRFLPLAISTLVIMLHGLLLTA